MTLENALMQDTDLRAFVELYRRFGIECKIEKDKVARFVIQFSEDDLYLEGYTTNAKFDGYNGFYSKIIFDAAGKFLSQGFWE